jgi:hypothetical protein
MSKTIAVEIPAPPEGWEYQARAPKEGEAFAVFNRLGFWDCDNNPTRSNFPNALYAYRVRDSFAERYEALGLPDGWAWTYDTGVFWKDDSDEPVFRPEESAFATLRRIVSGKAFKVEGGK